jgi:hypothetical protein
MPPLYAAADLQVFVCHRRRRISALMSYIYIYIYCLSPPLSVSIRLLLFLYQKRHCDVYIYIYIHDPCTYNIILFGTLEKAAASNKTPEHNGGCASTKFVSKPEIVVGK